MISLTDWIAVIPPEDKLIAYVGEHETVTRQFFLPDLTVKDYAFYLDIAFDLSTVTEAGQPRTIESTQQSASEVVNVDGTSVTSTANTSKESYVQSEVTVDCDAKTDIAPLTKLVKEDGILLTWTVLAQQTQLPGLLRATLRAVAPNGGVKKSSMLVFYVAPSVSASPAAPIALTEYEQMERAMVLALEQSAEATLDSFNEQLNEAVGDVTGFKTYVDEQLVQMGEDVSGIKDATEYLKEREVEITDELYRFPTTTELGRVYVPDNQDEARSNTGIFNADGLLMLVPADEQKIDARTDQHCPIVPANLEYAVKSVGDGYYAKVEDFGSGSIEFIVVTELPTEDIKSAIYLLPAAEGAEDNTYDEYIYTNGAWEKIGSAAVNVDMSQYLEKTATSASLNRVYGVAQNGTQKLFNASVNPFGDAVVLYAGGGVIRVNAPTADNHATNKAYVDAAIASVSGMSCGLVEVSREYVYIESEQGHMASLLKIVYSNGDVKYVWCVGSELTDYDGLSLITFDFTDELDSIGFQWDTTDGWCGHYNTHICSVSGNVFAMGQMYDASTDNWKDVTTPINVVMDGRNKKIRLYNKATYSEHTGYDELYQATLSYQLTGLEINFYKNPNFSAE